LRGTRSFRRRVGEVAAGGTTAAAVAWHYFPDARRGRLVIAELAERAASARHANASLEIEPTAD
jgi:hypothetical protein